MWLCRLQIALMTACGAAKKPARQPAMQYVFESEPMSTVRSFISGTSFTML